MNVLVLGASGFIGRHLIDELSGMPEMAVTAAIHKEQLAKSTGVRNISFRLEDINLQFLQQNSFDYIFHLARIPGGRYGDVSRWYAGFKARLLNERLLKCIDKLDRKPKLVYLSGSLMYGDHGKSATAEDEKLNPAGFAKYYYRGEKPFLERITKSKSIWLLRAPWVLGNGSWFQQLYKKPALSGRLPMYGNGGRDMSLITVEDCAAMLIYYALNAPPGIYNIYSHQMVYADFLDMVRKGSKRNVEISPPEKVDKTTKESICTEIVLGTNYLDLLKGYELKNPLLDNYIERIMHL